MEKRKLTRIPFIADTRIVYDMGALEGEIDNLSIGGVFIKTDGNIAENSKVSILMYLGGEKKPPIGIQGKVNRNEKKGIAIQFDDYTELNKKLADIFH